MACPLSRNRILKSQTFEDINKAGDSPFVRLSVLDVIEPLDAVIVRIKDPSQFRPEATTNLKMPTEIYSTQWLAEHAEVDCGGRHSKHKR